MKLYLFASVWGAIALITSPAATAVTFTPPADHTAPQSTTGGASRGSFFTPPTDSSAPQRAGGGASRGSFFTPPDDSPVPQRAGGGASRGSFFTPPADRPAPRRAAGGAARGDLPDPLPSEIFVPSRAQPIAPVQPDAAPIEATEQSRASARGNEYGTSLAPDYSTVAMLGLMPQNFYGTTISGHPTILVYLPTSGAQEAVFSLKDEERNLRYYVTVPISGQAGVYTFQLPIDTPALEVNTNYQWFVALKREGSLTPGSPFVDGWIKRIEASPQLATSLAQGDVLKQAQAFGAAGVWYDTVASLAALRQQQPDSEAIASHWNELLTSVGLQEISTAPLLVQPAP
jgi:Domain of Unknown Function (DUF928)